MLRIITEDELGLVTFTRYFDPALGVLPDKCH
jgi:hypothetical protein